LLTVSHARRKILLEEVASITSNQGHALSENKQSFSMKEKKYGSQVTVFALGVLLAIGQVVFVQQALAQGGGGGSGPGGGSGDQTQDRDQIQDRDRLQDPTHNTAALPIQDQLRDRDRDRIQDPATHDGDEPLQDRDQDRDRIRVGLENGTTSVGNAEQLRATIQNRERELNQEGTSTAGQYREIMQNQNRVRLAIHALYASEGLLGAAGPRMMQITDHMNNSVQATLNAEAEIHSRGLLTHILFGGDRAHAQILQQEEEQNRLLIQELKKLINEAIITTEIRVALMEQVRIMEEEQARLTQLAEKESGQWGIFSWRF
jgi:hypothetical protein